MMTKITYSGYRLPPEIIQQAIWLYVIALAACESKNIDDAKRIRLVDRQPGGHSIPIGGRLVSEIEKSPIRPPPFHFNRREAHDCSCRLLL